MFIFEGFFSISEIQSNRQLSCAVSAHLHGFFQTPCVEGEVSSSFRDSKHIQHFSSSSYSGIDDRLLSGINRPGSSAELSSLMRVESDSLPASVSDSGAPEFALRVPARCACRCDIVSMGCMCCSICVCLERRTADSEASVMSL